MIRTALLMLRKDMRLVLSGGGIVQSVLLGVVLVFLFSLSQQAGQQAHPEAVAGIFWLATCFAQVLIFNTLYSLEEVNNIRTALLLSPAPLHGLWLGKVLAGLLLLVFSQALFVPVIVIFLGQRLPGDCALILLTVFLVDWGVVVLGALAGGMLAGQEKGQTARESLLSVLVFPLLVPLLLAGIRTVGTYLSASSSADTQDWIHLVLAFDAVFTGAALLLFPFIYSAE